MHLHSESLDTDPVQGLQLVSRFTEALHAHLHLATASFAEIKYRRKEQTPTNTHCKMYTACLSGFC